MTGEDRQRAYAYLLDLSAQQGYVTIDDILHSAERWQLSINDTDWLSNSITMRGILVRDSEQDTVREKTNEEYSDYAQIDYDSIYSQVVDKEPSLKPFIDEVRRIRPPQFREFSKLVYQAKEGNEFARDRMVEMHLRVAIRIALQRSEQYDLDIMDCIEGACIGLMIAVDKYNPDTNGAFPSYASYWIFQTLSRMQHSKCPDVYFPVHRTELLLAMYPKLRLEGCTACDSVIKCSKIRTLIKDELKCSDSDVEVVIQQLVPFLSLEELNDSLILNDDEELDNSLRKLNEVFIDSDDLMSDIEQRDAHERIINVMSILKDREQKVIRERFGLDGNTPKTLEEIGDEMGVTRERIRQIEAKALRILRHPSRSRCLKGICD